MGRALRAVDSRLKWEWVQWAEDGLRSKDTQDEGRRQALELGLFKDEAANGAEVGSTGTATRSTEQDDAAADLGQRRSSPQRRRRRLRAWCIEVRERMVQKGGPWYCSSNNKVSLQHLNRKTGICTLHIQLEPWPARSAVSVLGTRGVGEKIERTTLGKTFSTSAHALLLWTSLACTLAVAPVLIYTQIPNRTARLLNLFVVIRPNLRCA